MRKPRILAAAAVLLAVIALFHALGRLAWADQSVGLATCCGRSACGRTLLMLVLAVAVPLIVRTVARAISERKSQE